MRRVNYILFGAIAALATVFVSCGEKDTPDPPPGPTPKNPVFIDAAIGSSSIGDGVYNISIQPVITVDFSEPLKQSTLATSISVTDASGVQVPVTATLTNSDKTVVVQPTASLAYLKKYFVKAATTLQSASGGSLQTAVSKAFITKMDSSRKFATISDNALLDLVQQQTFKYFWDFGHPISGLARERNSSGDVVTSGGSGFGIMAIPVGINRGFITRAQGLARMQTIVSFLKNTAVKVKGAFSHWLNGSTGAIVPFSANDNGADLVETSYLMMGLLTARQYFNGADAAETNLRTDINTLYNNVEWDWFRNGGQNVLYWHYSSNLGWIMNMPVRGWNECLITYVLAASSTTHGVPASVYHSGWATGSGFINGNTYYGFNLPLGPAQGGPLFFSHYSFMGINPNGLSDTYANYATQTTNHSQINYRYCIANPRSWYGYSDSCWGLTASDIPSGYTASSPTNDVSVIAPTAALSSMPYTPVESMKALKFFYYVLGDKLWKEYGFVDAFSLRDLWFAGSFLAIDQGPIIVMIENHRTGLLWNLFTSCPEVKAGMLSLSFSAPYL
ncbi:MAG: Ig-like domain-containing protein [Chitinophagaceae bacterium]|nr:Ig-like domain-containing protein [Chitinophagaceae bacterium]